MTIINSAESLYLSLPSVGVISRECIVEYDYQEVVCVIGRECIVEYDHQDGTEGHLICYVLYA